VFHLGWFLSYTVQGWNTPWSGGHETSWISPDGYVSMAKALERAGFDYMMFEDGSFIPDAYQGSMDYALAHAQTVPKHDPLTLIAPIAQETDHIGLIATMTTSFYPPFLAARLMTTLDHLSGGRVGVNLVTAHNDRTAQNYGLTQHYAHDQRYEMADEWVRACTALWESWDRDALTLDEETGIFADPAKVHYADFEGTYYKTRGPLNLPPGPQGRPVLCQAGASPAGRAFGGAHADTIIAQTAGVESMKRYREEVHAAARAAGRDPKDIKLLFLASFALGETQADAERLVERSRARTDSTIEAGLAMLSFSSGLDFGAYDLDEPLPEIRTNAAQGTTARLLERSEGKTLREIVSEPLTGAVDFVGTPDSVAAEMGELMEEVGGDGFLVQGPALPRNITAIADALCPALRKRGLIRDGYDFPTLRENLLAF
jgi:long-chain alkane monooxygenase